MTHNFSPCEGVNSGLMGLAYPGLTSVFEGTDPGKDEKSTPYDPLPFTAMKQGLLPNPFFSIALSRGSFDQQENEDDLDSNLGFLAWGGMAPVDVDTNTQTTVPIQGYNAKDTQVSDAGNANHFFYTVDVEKFSFAGSTITRSTASNNTILDTGTTLNSVPTFVADAFAAACDPPAKFSEDDEAYIVDCDATIPPFTVTINGVDFTIDPKDNLLPGDDEKSCQLGTTPGGKIDNKADDTFIL
jgi:hypothetical protein